MNNSRRRLKNAWVATALLGIFALAASPLPSAWKNWRYSRAVDLAPADATRLADVIVADEIYPRARPQLDDLRVIDDRATEVPYFLSMREGSTNRAILNTMLHEQSFTPGVYSQIVIEVGGQAPFHNSVQLLTGDPEFMEWTRVEASDDGHAWRIVQDRAPVFRFRNEGREGTQEVHYSENNARFLRVSILDGEKPFTLLGANVTYETVTPSERLPFGSALTLDPNPPSGETVWTVDVGAANPFISEVRFDVPPPTEFSRSVQISASDGNEEWHEFARGEIYRFHQGTAAQEELAVPIPVADARGHLWRIAVENGNDTPLADAVVRLYSTPRHVLFEQQPGRNYRLLYGQGEAQSASYDLRRRVNGNEMAQAVAGTLGSEEVNSDWSDPRPWTEKYDFALWIALGIAVFFIGLTAIRSLRRSASRANN
jgi:hypothetical protein